MDHEFNSELENLAKKWKEGTITEQERIVFDDWYNQHKDEQIELPEGYAPNPIVIRERMLDNIQQHIKSSRSKTYRLPYHWQKIVAAASVLLILGTAVYTFTRHKETGIKVQQTVDLNTVAPGINKAVLILADGRRLSLNDSTQGVLATQGATRIAKTAKGQITYVSTANNETSASLTNTIQTPKGGQFLVVLSDGTKVLLNAASSLQYPTGFSGKERKVILKGEGYFQVAHNKRMPFIVATANQEVKVLGTHFNVNSYLDEGKTITTLEEGSVQVQAGTKTRLISPGNQSVLLASGNLNLQPANMEIALGWKENKMVFEDARIEEIMRQLARWYDLDIKYEGKVPDDTFSGTINRQSNLATVLKMFELSQLKFRLVKTGSSKTLIIES